MDESTDLLREARRAVYNLCQVADLMTDEDAELLRRIDALLSREEEAKPDGMALVPYKPTDAMFDAAWNAPPKMAIARLSIDQYREILKHVWGAMWMAAPSRSIARRVAIQQGSPQPAFDDVAMSEDPPAAPDQVEQI